MDTLETNDRIYKFLESISNSVGKPITEYDCREVCFLMKYMEDNKMVTCKHDWVYTGADSHKEWFKCSKCDKTTWE